MVQDDIEEGVVHAQGAVVVNKAQLAEPIHKETDAGRVVAIMPASLSAWTGWASVSLLDEPALLVGSVSTVRP